MRSRSSRRQAHQQGRGEIGEVIMLRLPPLRIRMTQGKSPADEFVAELFL